MIVLCRYTAKGSYAKHDERLRASCEKLVLRFHISEVPDPGSWDAVCRMKPRWILDALLNRREAILWLDADCEVVQLPTLLLGTPHDFCVYNFAADHENGAGIAYDPRKLVCAAGTVMFGYTAPAIELLLRWAATVAIQAGRGGDPSLGDAYNTCRPPVNPLWLPKAYNRMDSEWPGIEPVINHVYRRGAFRDA